VWIGFADARGRAVWRSRPRAGLGARTRDRGKKSAVSYVLTNRFAPPSDFGRAGNAVRYPQEVRARGKGSIRLTRPPGAPRHPVLAEELDEA